MSTLMDLQRANLERMAAKEREAESPAESKGDAESVNNTTILQSDKPTDTQTSEPTNNPTDNLTDQPTNTPTVKQTNKLANKQVAKPAPKPPVKTAPAPEPEASPRRADGRTMRARQNTADRTMVTSLRLAVETVEALDAFCWSHRQRKQGVIQAALDMYFAAQEEEG